MIAQACLVLLGGFLGGVARLLVGEIVSRRLGQGFPFGTLVVNVTGAWLIGALSGLAGAAGGVFAGNLVRDFAVVGICGGYTTVSSFALQTLYLATEGETWKAGANILLSVGLSLVATATGFALVAALAG
jgi:fluoride exporter